MAYLEWCDGVERASVTFVPPFIIVLFASRTVLNFWEITSNIFISRDTVSFPLFSCINKVALLSVNIFTRHGYSLIKQKVEVKQFGIRRYIAISKTVVRENDECQLSNGNCTTEKKCGY